MKYTRSATYLIFAFNIIVPLVPTIQGLEMLQKYSLEKLKLSLQL